MSSRNRHSILIVVDKAIPMAHMVACSKSITTTDNSRILWDTMVKLHSVSRVIYSDSGG